MANIVRNSKGNVLLQILAATAVMSASFYFLTTYVIGQKQQVGKTANMVNLRFTLNSALDYVIFGIRQKYCFTNDGLLLNEAVPANCNLVHSGSVERVIMSEDQENFIKSMIEKNVNVGTVDKNNIRLNNISRYIRVGSATTVHPLFPVFEGLKSVRADDGSPLNIDGISVDITRNESPFLPKVGREVYLKVKVSLKSSATSAPLRLGSDDLSVVSNIVIYPREVGSFSLLVPNDLYLDKSYQDGVSTGDVVLHRFGSRAEMAGTQGLVFQSPVFVNRNIHIPVDDGRVNEATLNYSAVTFADRVYLGNGIVMSNGKPFQPLSSGSSDHKYWSDLRSFGGFLRGVENDGGLDQGLLYFAKIMSGTKPSTEMMEECRKLDANADAKTLANSGVQNGSVQTSSGKSRYRISLSNYNRFSEQSIPGSLIDRSKWPGRSSKIENGHRDDVIMKVTLDLGKDNLVQGELRRGASLVAEAKVGTDEYIASVNAKLVTTKKALSDAEKRRDEVAANEKTLAAQIETVRRKLNDELSKPIKPTETGSSGGSSGSDGSTSSSSSSSSASGTSEREVAVENTSSSDSSSSGSGSTSSSGTSSGSSGSGSSSVVDYQDPKVVAQLKKQESDLQKSWETSSTSLMEQNNLVSSARQAVNDQQRVVNDLNNKIANPPQFEIKAEGVEAWSWWGKYDSPYKVDLEVSYKNMSSLIDKDGLWTTKPTVRVLAYDASYYRGVVTNPKYNNSKLAGQFVYTISPGGTDLNPPSSMTGVSSSSDSGEVDDLAAKCEELKRNQGSQAFGNAGWDVSFASSTRTSWNFAGEEGSTNTDPVLGTLEFTSGSDNKFQVRSIVGSCVIHPDATFVTGFYACDKLTILPRTTHLRIVGTFITSQITIDPSAYKAGITWSSIYHPQATRELRQREILESVTGRSCDLESADPIWHPVPSVQEVADVRACNSISLRAKGEPFQWTSVDPDCGLVSNAANTTCKKRLIRFFVVEQSREGGT